MAKEIPLTRGMVALVDEEDYDRLVRYKWHPKNRDRRWYAERERRVSDPDRPLKIYMHRAVLMAPKGKGVDHKNGNGLDNRRENLRLATDAENTLNRGKGCNNKSGFKGVSYKKGCRGARPWVAMARFRGRGNHLGYFETPEEAARAYDEFAKEHHGEFARLNFPERLTP